MREESTRWVEKKIGYDTLVWICEECEFTTQFECDGPEENNYNFCPQCGRKIAEYVPYRDPLDEEDEG